VTDPKKQDLLRELPSVDRLTQLEMTKVLMAQYGRSLTLESLRFALEAVRQAILSDNGRPQNEIYPIDSHLIQAAQNWLVNLLAPTLQPIINATGVIVHTNLGRAPLSRAALDAVQAVSGDYSTLEFDLDSGKRGSRSVHAENLLTRLTEAEAANHPHRNVILYSIGSEKNPPIDLFEVAKDDLLAMMDAFGSDYVGMPMKRPGESDAFGITYYSPGHAPRDITDDVLRVDKTNDPDVYIVYIPRHIIEEGG